jgi:cardiolipin synthase
MGSCLSVLLGICIVMAMLPAVSSAPGPSLEISTAGSFRASAAAGSIIINEVMFDPFGSEVEGEWVELFNPGAQPVDVTNWTLSDQDGGDVDFTFPELVFPVGGIALIHICQGPNSTSFIDGKAEFFMGKTSYLLPSTGDDVLLSNSTGATVDFMSYGQWNGAYVSPPPPDFPYTHSNATAPEGFSLARLNGEFRASVPSALYANGNDSTPAILLVEVHYASWAGVENEFITVHNPLAYAVDISFWYISNLKGKAALPSGTIIQPFSNITVAQNSTNYRHQLLRAPDFEYDSENSSIANMLDIGTTPVLANDGDEVFLLNNYGTVIDAFAYGTSFYTGTGWTSGPADALSQGLIAKRNFDNGFLDTNTSADWANIRKYAIGQSNFLPTEIASDGPIQLFVSPDSSFGAVTGVLDNASQRIWLTLYEFTQYPLANRLIAAAHRGVDVKVFLEGAPVGGLTVKELYIARKIVDAGGEVRIITNDRDNKIYERYDYVHAKYMIVDQDTLVMMSENWGEYGVPIPGQIGNRGWGAVVQNFEAVAYFEDVFNEDWNPERMDSIPFDNTHTLWDSGVNSTSENPPTTPVFMPRTIISSSVLTPVLSPDTSLSKNTIIGMLASATERVYVEEFYAYKHWGDRTTGSVESTPNLYIEAVIDAARRGCEVKVLLDATYYNSDVTDPIDNDDTVAYVNEIALAEGLDLEAKLVNITEHDFEKIHNKGLIADDSVLISSINWNLNSVTRNRESGLIIENADVAAYFTEVFEDDWKDDRTLPFAHFRINDAYKTNTTIRLNASTSSDNVGIVNYTWALDGQPVCYGLYFSRYFVIPGTYQLNLTVFDAWGNSDSYNRALNITEGSVGDGDETDNDPDDANNTDLDDSMMRVIFLALLIPIFLFAVLILLVIARRRR